MIISDTSRRQECKKNLQLHRGCGCQGEMACACMYFRTAMCSGELHDIQNDYSRACAGFPQTVCVVVALLSVVSGVVCCVHDVQFSVVSSVINEDNADRQRLEYSM